MTIVGLAGRVSWAGLWLAIIALGGAASASAGGVRGSGVWPGPWAADTVLSPEERRELEERRALVKARAVELAARLDSCRSVQSRVREGLIGIRHIQAVEVGSVLLTSHPPRVPVSFAVELGSGRVLWDRLTVVAPVTPRLLPLADGGATLSCPAPRG